MSQPPPDQPDTKQRILAAAERLFAQRGFEGTSLRDLTAEAEVNLAAVNYHFGSKEALFQQVVEGVIGPVNQERLRLFDELEARGGEPGLEELLEAFIGPALLLGARKDEPSHRLIQIMGRLNVTDGGCVQELKEVFKHVEQRFVPALRRALPGLSPKTFFWRLDFMISVMCMTLFDPARIGLVSGGLCDADEPREALRQMVAFTAAGLRAPESVPEPAGREEQR